MRVPRPVCMLAVILLVEAPHGAQPQEQSKAARQVANNLSHELLICSVYYRIVSECISKHYRGAHVRS
jgi:hypothetical protein